MNILSKTVDKRNAGLSCYLLSCSLLALALGGGWLATWDLLGELSEFEWSVLSVDHYLESVKVVQAGSLSSNCEFLWLCSCGPLLVKLVFGCEFPNTQVWWEGGKINLLNSSGSSTSENSLNFESSESESLEWVEHTGETSGGSIDEDSVGVGNVNNNNNFAQVFSEVYVSNSAWFNEVLENLHRSSLTKQDSQHTISSIKLYIK